ncbi:helix-turn-helix domain-containing protein [Streptomyces cavernicola]|uniref:Helix-turn-helix domain-containing protein n=1 Tax=Streptomyces cavernicola TaxID=3043613 RepID=A0ABT6S3G9_9ACTN|nr:helix-turn-helix domain-containing protein [Streptomyces sp. B-S-A6]MDI3402632.1 helix-turn-helix domain-containing protein [Streptomyces sp. B-S-A6]
MFDSSRTWTLEQNDRLRAFATGPEATLFAESAPFAVTRHRHPAWKVVLPTAGHTVLGRGARPPLTAPGLIVPPQLAHTCATTSGYAALFLDAWHLRPDLGLVRLDQHAVRRLLAALGPVTADAAPPDLPAVHAELHALLRPHTGTGPTLDARVVQAVREAARPVPHAPLDEIAADVGLSPPRLRALVRESVGVPLALLRRWSRLREAVAALPHSSPADSAAAAGFADQPHLTRTSRTLLARTPGSLRGNGR